MARMNVVFEDTLLDEMRDLVPARQRSGFIEDAVRARLAQLKQVRAAEAAMGAWSNEGRKDPSEAIEEGRRAWESRQPEIERGSADG
jgi:metal-responsive CopG/Arc/MetJ family transcriptional regulator